MNAFRKIGQTRTYKERAQPKARRHKGFLEKKRDYLVRARNYKEKREKLRSLKRQAELRNEDEFYFVGKQRVAFFFSHFFFSLRACKILA